MASRLHILLVEDFEPFRRFIGSVLSQNRDLEIIAEASDGAEAAKKVQHLKPDLVLLDISLPMISGLEAARQIRELAPQTKILFLSAYESVEIIGAALRTGASGYVLKADAGTELFKAVEAVARGEQFISSTLRKRIPADEAPAPRTSHGVHFYSDDEAFLDRAGRFIANAINTDSSAIVVATKAHRESLARELQMQGFDLPALIQRGVYIPLDAAERLSTFMADGWPDETRFLQDFGDLIESAAKAAESKNSRVAICGEGVALLCVQGKLPAAIRVEQLCNILAQKFSVDFLCAYPFSLRLQNNESSFRTVCAEHSAVYCE